MTKDELVGGMTRIASTIRSSDSFSEKGPNVDLSSAVVSDLVLDTGMVVDCFNVTVVGIVVVVVEVDVVTDGVVDFIVDVLIGVVVDVVLVVVYDDVVEVLVEVVVVPSVVVCVVIGVVTLFGHFLGFSSNSHSHGLSITMKP